MGSSNQEKAIMMVKISLCLLSAIWLNKIVAQGICRDESNNCQSWSNTGECRVNPGYMLVYCKKSCGVCTGPGPLEGVIQGIIGRIIQGPLQGSYGSCRCINPFVGRFDSHIGDPVNTCPTFCYVNCNSNCGDVKPAKGGGRCFSERACGQTTPSYPPSQKLCECINYNNVETCRSNYCYVDRNSDCNDKSFSGGRWWSAVACRADTAAACAPEYPNCQDYY